MTRLALLFCLLLCGCLTPQPVPPGPDDNRPGPVAPTADGSIATMGRLYEANFRESCLIAAEKLKSGAWKTDRDYLDGHRKLRQIAVEHSGQAFAERQEREATPFQPERMAEWLQKIAREDQP